MPESPANKLGYWEVQQAQLTYHRALKSRFFAPRIGIGMSCTEDKSWYLVLSLEKEKHRKIALKVAKKAIPNVPIKVRVTGKIVAA